MTAVYTIASLDRCYSVTQALYSLSPYHRVAIVMRKSNITLCAAGKFYEH